MDFSKVVEWKIPEGNVVKVVDSYGQILWQIAQGSLKCIASPESSGTFDNVESYDTIAINSTTTIKAVPAKDYLFRNWKANSIIQSDINQATITIKKINGYEHTLTAYFSKPIEADLLIYLKLQNDVNDYSGHNHIPILAVGQEFTTTAFIDANGNTKTIPCVKMLGRRKISDTQFQGSSIMFEPTGLLEFYTPNKSDPDKNRSFTIQVWFKCLDSNVESSSYNMIDLGGKMKLTPNNVLTGAIRNGASEEREWTFGIRKDTSRGVWFDTFLNLDLTDWKLTKGWHFYCVSFDHTATAEQKNAHVYIDGKHMNSRWADPSKDNPLYSSYKFNNYYLNIGSDGAGLIEYFNGYLREFKLYQRVRTADQIHNDFVQGLT